MTLTSLHSKLFDVGDLPVLTFGNRVLKTGVIKWPKKLRTFFFVFFQNPKSMTFYVFLSCCTRFLERWLSVRTPVEELSDQFASESIFVTLSQTMATYLPIIGGT